MARIIKSVVVENDYSIDIILLEGSEGYIVVYSGDETFAEFYEDYEDADERFNELIEEAQEELEEAAEDDEEDDVGFEIYYGDWRIL